MRKKSNQLYMVFQGRRYKSAIQQIYGVYAHNEKDAMNKVVNLYKDADKIWVAVDSMSEIAASMKEKGSWTFWKSLDEEA